jgi:hypothetical protein
MGMANFGSPRSGRHSGTATMPGSTRSRPSNQAVTSARSRSATGVLAIWFQRRWASGSSLSMSLAGCMIAR